MKTYKLKLTSAIVIAGSIARAGTEVEIDEPTAKDLLHRGRAELVFAQVPPPSEALDLTKANKKTLLQIAGNLGLEIPEKATNAQLIALIEAAGTGAEDFEDLDDRSNPDNENENDNENDNDHKD